MIPGPPGPPGQDGQDGEDGESGGSVVIISAKANNGQFAQTLNFQQSLQGKQSGTLPRNISRVTVRIGNVSPNLPLYGTTETGEKLGGYGTVALIINDVIVHQYSLNRFSDVQMDVPYGVDQTVEVFVSPIVPCSATILDEGDRWMAARVIDPENLPEVSAQLLNP